MQIKDIMTKDPACCTPLSTLEDAARLMVEFDCGEIPVVDEIETAMPVGVITDRDIICRAVGKGLNPLTMSVGDCMSSPVISVKPDDSLDGVYELLEQNQIRRVPVVDDGGKCIGIVALADIARIASKANSGEILREVSEETLAASNVGK